MRRIILGAFVLVSCSSCIEALSLTEVLRVDLGVGSSVAHMASTPDGYYVSNDHRIVFVSDEGDVTACIDAPNEQLVLGMDYRDGLLVFLSGNPGFFAEVYVFDERVHELRDVTHAVWSESAIPLVRSAHWIGQGRLAVEMVNTSSQTIEVRAVDVGSGHSEPMIAWPDLNTLAVNRDGSVLIVQRRDDSGRAVTYWAQGTDVQPMADVQLVIDAAFVSISTAVLVHLGGASVSVVDDGELTDATHIPSSNRVIDVGYSHWTSSLMTLERNSGRTLMVTYRLSM